jgi:GAF domain-containing protein
MAKDIRLARMVRRDNIAALLAAVSAGQDAVFDATGRQLTGTAVDGSPVSVTSPDGTILGTVTGPRAALTARVLSHLAGIEQERRGLADEVLDMYREVNLLYALGEVLATARDRSDLASRALREATRHVAVDDAYVVVDVDGPVVEAALHEAVMTGLPDDLTHLRIETFDDGARLVAPLAFRETERGAIVLHRGAGTFDAADLKLTGAVAAQCAGVLERIVDEEHRAAAAAAREAALRRQLDQLRIELDHERQAEQVEKVTETDYFGGLRAQASDLRRIIADRPG